MNSRQRVRSRDLNWIHLSQSLDNLKAIKNNYIIDWFGVIFLISKIAVVTGRSGEVSFDFIVGMMAAACPICI